MVTRCSRGMGGSPLAWSRAVIGAVGMATADVTLRYRAAGAVVRCPASVSHSAPRPAAIVSVRSSPGACLAGARLTGHADSRFESGGAGAYIRGGNPLLRFITYSPHLSAALAAVTTALLPYYGTARWFVAFPAVTAGLAALGIGPGSQASRSVQAVTPTLPAGPQ